jgi:hypothetical protein
MEKSCPSPASVTIFFLMQHQINFSFTVNNTIKTENDFDEQYEKLPHSALFGSD